MRTKLYLQTIGNFWKTLVLSRTEWVLSTYVVIFQKMVLFQTDNLVIDIAQHLMGVVTSLVSINLGDRVT